MFAVKQTNKQKKANNRPNKKTPQSKIMIGLKFKT